MQERGNMPDRISRRAFSALPLLPLTMAVPAIGQVLPFVWPEAAAAAVDIDADLPDKLRQELMSNHRRTLSFAIVRRGKLVFEYFNADTGPETLVNVASVTKSVLGLLVGIAFDKGIFRSVAQPITDFFPELQREGLDPRTRTVTLAHLLSMSAGWESKDTDEPSPMPTDALFRRLAFEPGATFQYDNATSHLIAIAIARAAGEPLEKFAEKHLFEPLGITQYVWGRDAQGRTLGWHRLQVKLRDMLKFGQLLVNRGLWSERRIVSLAWLGEMLTRRNDGGPPSRTPYGYQWYVFRTPDKQHQAYGAFGYGGQLIYVVPALELVIARTQMRDQRGADNRFIREMVMPAIRP